MNSASGLGERRIWAFWAAAGLSALAAVAPIAFSGTSGRANGAFLPLLAGSAAFAACALLHGQGRTVTAILFFVAGLAVVFGLLSMFSLPLRLAVLGTCPAAPAPCTSGLERPLTDAENTGIGVASVLGIVSVFVGFFALAVLYRRSPVAPATPPVRRIPPMPPAAELKATEPAAAEAKPDPRVEITEEPELPAHEEEDLPELPAHESSSPKT